MSSNAVLVSRLQAYQQAHYTTAAAVEEESTSGVLVARTTAKNVSSAQPTGWDPTPPATFLAAADQLQSSPPPTYGCDAAGFFGPGGAARPALKVTPCDGGADSGALIVERPVTVAAGGTVTLRQLYGYVPSTYTVEQLVAKYDAVQIAKAREQLGKRWNESTTAFDAPAHPQIGREVKWHAGYLRQALTFYDFFNETMLDQGSQYRYSSGFEGATRDPLQHALPLVHSAPEQAASILRLALQQMVPPAAWGPPKPAGPYGVADSAWNTPYALVGGGQLDEILYGVQLNGASDLELYMLLLGSEYLLATKDAAFLDTRIPFRYKVDKAPHGQPDRSALEALGAAFTYLVNHTGVGPHGLIRVQSGDWNDGFSELAGCGRNAKCQREVQAEAESLMNSAMATFIYGRFADALEMANASVTGPAEQVSPATVRAAAQQQRAALLKHGWNGEWLNRAWLPNRGFVGTNGHGDPLGITLEPQPWALLSGMLNATQQDALVASVTTQLATRIGLKQAGTGHVWTALHHPMVMGIARVNKSAAWDAWRANTLANHAELFPTLWPGVWSMADYVRGDSGISGGGGFPLLNGHRHAWPLYSLVAGLAGVEFSSCGVTVRPWLPEEVGPYKLRTRLATVERTAEGTFRGTVRPRALTSACSVVVEIPAAAAAAAAAAAGKKGPRWYPMVARAKIGEASGGGWVTAEMTELVAGGDGSGSGSAGNLRAVLNFPASQRCGDDRAVQWTLEWAL